VYIVVTEQKQSIMHDQKRMKHPTHLTCVKKKSLNENSKAKAYETSNPKETDLRQTILYSEKKKNSQAWALEL
jgi:hypothetical protein